MMQALHTGKTMATNLIIQATLTIGLVTNVSHVGYYKAGCQFCDPARRLRGM